MRDSTRWWYVVGVAAFVGAYVVPLLSVAVSQLSVTASLAAAAAPVAGPPSGFVLLRAVLAVALVAAVPGLGVGLFLDARGQHGPWDPSPRRYGVAGLLYPISVVVAAAYLLRRYRRVGLGSFAPEASLPPERLAASRWWVLVPVGAASFVAGVAVLAAPAGGPGFYPGSLIARAVLFALLAGTGLVAYVLGLGVDLRLVRNGGCDWTPGLRRYELPGLLLPVSILPIAAVYLANRHRHVGVP